MSDWLLAALVTVAYGQDEAPAGEEIEVVASRTPGAGAPVALTVLDEGEIGQGRPTLELGESLMQVPGVFVANRWNFAQDTRLSIRGFGSRSAFGIRGIRVVLDGIPLTLPDGQSQIDSLDLQNIGRVEVLRGAAGSTYGNAAGGVLVLETIRPGPGPEAEIINTVGSFGLWKAAVAGRTRTGESEVSLFVSRTAMAGWREQSSVEQVVAQSTVAMQLAPGVRWSTHVHFVRAPVADDPGGVDVVQLDEDPRGAAQTNLDFRTGEDLSQLQVGTRLLAQVAPDHRVEAVAYAGLRTFEGRIPFRIVSFDRDFFGALALYRWRAARTGLDHQLTAGLEWQGQRDLRRNEGNDGGLPDGVVSLDQDERVTGLGAYVQEQLQLGRVQLLASGRYDHVGFGVTDRHLADGDRTGERRFGRLTGQGGVSVGIVTGVSGYASVAQSFETPTLSELVSASGDGGLDDDLRAQEALTVESGVRAGAGWGRVEVAGFWIGLDNELVRQEDSKGRAFFDNAGRSRRLGVELAGQLEPLPWLELRGSYTWLRAEFRDSGRVGVRVPGIPEHHGFARARVQHEGLTAAVETEVTSARWADDANTTAAPPWGVVGVRAGYALTLARVELDLTLGVRNLLDAATVDNTRVNAFGGRYFEAGAPRHVYAQLRAAVR